MAGSAIWRQLEGVPGIKLIGRTRQELDLLNRNDVFDFMSKESPDVVILAAAKVGGILANNDFPVEFLTENIQVQVNVMDSAHKANVERLLFLGSSCIYPKFATQPINESSLLTGELEPTNEPYAIAKIAGLKLVNAYRNEYGHAWFSVMPTNLYGPGDNYDLQSSHVLPAVIAKFENASRLNQDTVTLWGTGLPKREFMHVDDLASACVYLLENYDDSVAVNVGTGKDVTIKELAELIMDLSGFTGDLVWDTSKPDGTPRKLLDVSYLHKLGWKHKIELEIGVKSVIQNYLSSLA
jgi:GDP-L-fucose synthase